jgi:hypothetical protein
MVLLKNVLCLDFEASGLGPGSYPIEVAIADCESGECTSWLIRPTETWLSEGIWSEDSFDVHNGLVIAGVVAAEATRNGTVLRLVS